MSHTHVRTAPAVALVAALLFGASSASADELRVTIRLYDTATTDAATRLAAMRTAAAVIADAGIAVHWLDCSRGGSAHPCRSVRGPHDLVVRIMPVFVEQPRAAGERPREEGRDPDIQLGFAAVDPAGRENVMATIYYDRVLRVARRAGLDTSGLLGRAIAHEIGHLLLRLPGHNRSGLMRAVWTDAELVQNRRDDWTFTEAERRRLQATALDPDDPESAPATLQLGRLGY